MRRAYDGVRLGSARAMHRMVYGLSASANCDTSSETSDLEMHTSARVHPIEGRSRLLETKVW